MLREPMRHKAAVRAGRAQGGRMERYLDISVESRVEAMRGTSELRESRADEGRSDP